VKFLAIQECGRHERNRGFREALNMQRALERLGHECVVWGLRYGNFSANYSTISQDCDVVIVLENYDTGWLPVDEIAASRKLKVFWSIDSHCALNQHLALAHRIRPQILLNATERYLRYFDFIPHRHWFPNCYPSDLIGPRPDVPKAHDIGFCGNVSNRAAWLDLIQERFGLKRDVFVLGDDMVRAINSYRISFNRNIADDINYRTFETTGCGTLLLTNTTPGIERLFDLGREIVDYSGPEDLCQKIAWYLQHPGVLDEVAAAGQRRALRDHTYDQRAKLLVELVCH
jgi:hypothetical protein